jgi:MFS family permease
MRNQETVQNVNTKERFFYGYFMVVAGFIAMMIILGTRMSYGVFFKPIIAEFGWSRALISGAFSISSAMQGLGGMIMGNLNDRVGPRVVISLCGLLAGTGMLLMSQVNTVWQLYFFYTVFIGLGNSSFSSLLSTVARWFVKRRSVMSGIVIAGGGIGIFIFSPITNWLVTTYGWRDSYIITGIGILAVVITIAQFLSRDPAKKGLRPYGENTVEEKQPEIVKEGYSLGEAIGTIRLWMAIAVFFCFGYCGIAFLVHIIPHVTDLGISPAVGANILAINGGASVIGGIILGGTADRIGNRQGFVICFILLTVALLWLLIAGEDWAFYVVSFILGLGCGGTASMQSPIIADLFGMKAHGSILGLGGLGFTLGSAAGPFVSGYIFDVNSSYQPAFIVCVAMGFIGLILSALLRPAKQTGNTLQK